MNYRSVCRAFMPAALAAVGLVLFCPAPVLASEYWTGFKKFWGGYVAQQNGVVMTALIVGVISVFIVTRGRWKK